jgi:hypothetical protein
MSEFTGASRRTYDEESAVMMSTCTVTFEYGPTRYPVTITIKNAKEGYMSPPPLHITHDEARAVRDYLNQMTEAGLI